MRSFLTRVKRVLRPPPLAAGPVRSSLRCGRPTRRRRTAQGPTTEDEALKSSPGSSTGLAFSALSHGLVNSLMGWDKFSRDVGRLFEAYVGHNLELMHGALVYPAITYGRDKRESTDWIAVFDGVTLLVEVKSTRPTENVRIGNDSTGKDLQKRLTKAYKQIDATAKLIQDRHADFAAIPAGNSIVGLVVTMEPFHVINATPYRNLLPLSDIPIRVCDASELERLVAVKDVTVGQLLLAYVQDLGKVDWSVNSALQGFFSTQCCT